PALDRYAEHRQRRQGGDHAGKMSSPSGPGDDYPQPARARRAGILIKPFRGAVRRNDTRLIADVEPIEGARGVLHRLPIGLASHDDAYRATCAAHSISSTMWLRGVAILEAGSAHTSALTTGRIPRLATCQAMISGSSSLSIFEIWSLSSSF